jgi:23S rRNA pseudouridine1911/1915/1917 synthase
VPFLNQELLVDEQSPHLGGRIDRCVQELVGCSRSFVTGLFDHDCVTLNGEMEPDGGRFLNAGDRIILRYEANRRYSPRRRPREKHQGFSILHEDRHLIVVEKSADLLTVPTERREPYTLIYRVNEHVRHQDRRSAAVVVHRLDLGVSGLLVFAKSQDVAKTLQQQFRDRKPERQYDAIVSGIVKEDAGEFRSHLITAKSLTRYSTEDPDDGELAITHYQVASRMAGTTHVVVRLETGRRNQIRVHFSEAGHSVLGDQRYRPDLWAKIDWPFRRLALHAGTLGFQHPVTEQPLQFHSPLPREMTKFLSKYRPQV